MESRTARLASFVTIVVGLAGGAAWGHSVWQKVDKVPQLEKKVEELDNFKDRTDRRLCLILETLGKQDTGCYR